jgi:hypothetical protein
MAIEGLVGIGGQPGLSFASNSQTEREHTGKKMSARQR